MYRRLEFELTCCVNELLSARVTGAKGQAAARWRMRSGRGDEGWRVGDVETAAEIVPERDAELVAGFHQAEEGVAAVAASPRTPRARVRWLAVN